MKVLIFGSQARYQAYQPDFVAQLPVDPVFCPIDQPLHEAAARHSDAQALFVDAISASYENGVLKLTLPKQGEPEPQSRKIAIQ